MKNFDEERTQAAERTLEARTFVLGGTTFHARAFVTPEAINNLTHEGHDTLTSMYDAWACELIEEDEAAAWQKMRKDGKPPVNLQNLEDVVIWLVEVASGRPTVPPSPSRTGPAKSEATSRAPSRSQVTTAA